eukprot:scaffold18482_cov183-Amphora_coffeaeformis.AAC.2
MGGQERCCRGGGVPEMARGLVQWVGRNQGCNGGHGDGGDDGGGLGKGDGEGEKTGTAQPLNRREWDLQGCRRVQDGGGFRDQGRRRRAGGDGDLVDRRAMSASGGQCRRRPLEKQ